MSQTSRTDKDKTHDNPAVNKSCERGEVRMQGLETIQSPLGPLVYLWGVTGHHFGGNANAQSGLARKADFDQNDSDLNNQSTSRIKCSTSHPNTRCNGAPATPSGRVIKVKVRKIPPAMNHGGGGGKYFGKYVYRTFKTYGSTGAYGSYESDLSHGHKRTTLVWSLFNRSLGGVNRAHVLDGDLFYLAKVKPVEVASYRMTTK